MKQRALTLMLKILLVLAAALPLTPAHAHKASDAYLQFSEPAAAAPRITLSIALKDLDAAIDTLDADNNRSITWGEVKAATPALVAWVSGGVSLQCNPLEADKAAALGWAFDSLEQRADGTYLRLVSPMPVCAQTASLTLGYRLMQGIDPTHRLLISGQLAGNPIAAVLDPQTRPVITIGTALGTPLRGATTLQTGPSPQSGRATLAHFFAEGVHHLLSGYDHLAFLLVLLLPIMLTQRVPQSALANPSKALLRPGLHLLLRTVTGFTIGHSVTLIASSLGWIAASSSWVEPAIAITIALSALLNLHPIGWLRGDVLALVFGLVHGLGFSSLMIEAGISGSLLFWALAGFNLGIEAGQLAGVAVWCALHLSIGRWRYYELVVIKGGSLALLLVAIYWTLQRVGAP